jgi:DNA topoisomerase-1
MVASQMALATFNSTTVDIEARCPVSKIKYLLTASSLVNIFPGFIILYTEGKDDNGDTISTRLPPLEKGDRLKLIKLISEQNFTQPPPRFSEATLIKMLEQEGIGRPSTYAPILSTIQDREYVTRTNGRFKPTELGIIVNDLLTEHFSGIVNIDFTARMEDELDKIANEGLKWRKVVDDFYQPLEKELQSASKFMQKVKIADKETGEACPNCGKPIIIKTGRFGRFLACSGFPDCKYTTSFQVKTGAKCPECSADIVEKQNKKKRTFYSCSNYPECRFATNYKPLPLPCPECGGLMVVSREKWSKCLRCKHKKEIERE